MDKKFLGTSILCLALSSCTWMKGTPSPPENEPRPPTKIVKLPDASALQPKDLELQRLARYLEQADAVHREAWWVVAADRKPPGKTIFGKVQRGLAQELKQKLTNKNLYTCDRYVVQREILSPSGLPQKGSVLESCRANQTSHLADFDLKTKTDAVVVFQGQNLGEALGLGTAILNKYITCEFKGDEEGRLTDLVCKDLSQDRNATQSLNFTVYEYHRGNQNLLKLRGQVVEALYPIRKFEADVPLAGKIHVVETQTEAPEGSKPKMAVKTAAPAPSTNEGEIDSATGESAEKRNAGVRGGAAQTAPAVLVRPTKQRLDPDMMLRREGEEGVSVEEQIQQESPDPQNPGGPSPDEAMPAEVVPPPAAPATPSRR